MRRSSLPLVAGFPLLVLAACTMQRQTPPPAAHVPNEIMVDGGDYAFTMPETLAPGATKLRFRNVGKVPHEMAMARLKAGATARQFMEAMRNGDDVDSLLDGVVGILIASPGATTIGALEVDLVAGRTYLFGCNFQDDKDAPPHSTMGMIATRTIATK